MALDCELETAYCEILFKIKSKKENHVNQKKKKDRQLIRRGMRERIKMDLIQGIRRLRAK
jgi:coproporphyrinogen III oxidase